MSGPIHLYINNVLISRMEWGMSSEEVLGGTGRATIRIQDRDNDYEPKCHWPVKIVIAATGWVLFNGEIITEPVELPVAMPWRTWQLDCADWNNELPQRLVGAFDGHTWEDPEGLGYYVNVDHYANSLKTDKKTVKRLLHHYVRVNGEEIETDTYVFKYLEDFATIYWAYSDVQSALEDLAAQITENLQFWIDPDLKFHWVTIPEWQDLLQETLALNATEDQSLLASMMPEGTSDFDLAPYEISDDGTAVGGRELRFTFDGSEMPQQIYVRGSTGFVYNAGKIDPEGDSKVVNPTGYGSNASEDYQVTFNEPTKIWTRDEDGYIDSSFVTVPASGPFDVVFMNVPWNEVNSKGGHFWKMTSGPNKGWLVDNDTNYFGYGDMTIRRLVATKTDPKIGVGGSGWVKDNGTIVPFQDPNKRQAYLDAPISSSKKIRDAVGGQALYRARYPTLRGSVKVSGHDGWRVGQIVRITDARLPATLNGRYFMIQRVQTTLIPATHKREYVLDWGDGPTSRWSMHAKMKPYDPGHPATQIEIHVFDLSPGPNSEQTVMGQLCNKSGSPWHIAGKVVRWTLETYTASGARATGGSLTPLVSITDQHGRARTVFKSGPQAGYTYWIFANVAAN